MNENKVSFYLERENKLFGGIVITACYKATAEEQKKYNLTSENILLIFKHNDFAKIEDNSKCNYLDEIKKNFKNDTTLLRIQCECLLGVFGDSHCDCEERKKKSIELISKHNGIFIHLPQEAQGWGLHYKLQELELQVSGRVQNGNFIGKKDRDTAQQIILKDLNYKSFIDNRNYDIIYHVLDKLDLTDCKFSIITDSDKKIKSLTNSGLKVSKYINQINADINSENVSEYLIKIYNLSHDYSQEYIDKIIEVLKNGINERSKKTLLKIINRINNDSNYFLNDTTKVKFLKLFKDLIIGEEKDYVKGNDNYVSKKNNFSCIANSTIFKILCEIYKTNVFDRLTKEKMFYFTNINDNSKIRVRVSEVLDNSENCSNMFVGQTYLVQSVCSDKIVVQREISNSRLRSYFENNDYNFVKSAEMITTISEGMIPNISIYLKKVPKIDGHVMDIYGPSDDIYKLIKKIKSIDPDVLLDDMNNKSFAEQNFSQYNLCFSNIDSVVEEEKNMYNLMEEKYNGVRSKVLLSDRRKR